MGQEQTGSPDENRPDVLDFSEKDDTVTEHGHAIKQRISDMTALKQTEEDGSIRQDVLARRFGIWKTLLQDMEKTAVPERTIARFPNSSSYVFSTGRRTFWLMDPAFSSIGEAPEGLPVIADLIAGKFTFAVITHLHRDHCDFELVKL